MSYVIQDRAIEGCWAVCPGPGSPESDEPEHMGTFGARVIAKFYGEHAQQHAILFVDALTKNHEPLVKEHMARVKANDMRSLE